MTNKITLKMIDERNSTVAKMGAELNSFIHETAMMIFYHAAPKDIGADCQGSGDCTRAVKTVRAMPASMRRTMLIEWFTKNTPIRIKLSDNGDKCEYDPKYKKLSIADKLTWWNLENAASEPFYDLAEQTPEKAPLSFEELMKLVARLASAIEKRVEKGEVQPEAIDSAKEIARALTGLKVKAPSAVEAFGEVK